MALKSVQWHQHTMNISYEIVNPQSKHDMVVLHGWGSNKELMRDVFSKELETFRHIYIDLPGFGNSTSPCVMDSQDYAEVISIFLELLGIEKDLIMGHSFGGKVATLLEPDLLVLLSTAGIKEPKPLKIWAKIYLFKLMKFFGFTWLRTKFLANDAKALDAHMYETFKKVINEDFENIFRQYTKKSLIFWGQSDTATKLSSGEKIHALIKQSQFKAYPGDHYFFLHHVKEIAQTIQNVYISH